MSIHDVVVESSCWVMPYNKCAVCTANQTVQQKVFVLFFFLNELNLIVGVQNGSSSTQMRSQQVWCGHRPSQLFTVERSSIKNNTKVTHSSERHRKRLLPPQWSTFACSLHSVCHLHHFVSNSVFRLTSRLAPERSARSRLEQHRLACVRLQRLRLAILKLM